MKELRKASREIKKYLDENFETMTNDDAKNKLNEIFANEAKIGLKALNILQWMFCEKRLRPFFL